MLKEAANLKPPYEMRSATLYSITWSARASSMGGTSTPIAFAALAPAQISWVAELADRLVWHPSVSCQRTLHGMSRHLIGVWSKGEKSSCSRPRRQRRPQIIASAMLKQAINVAVLSATTTKASSLCLSKFRSMGRLRPSALFVQIEPLTKSTGLQPTPICPALLVRGSGPYLSQELCSGAENYGRADPVLRSENYGEHRLRSLGPAPLPSVKIIARHRDERRIVPRRS